MKRTALERKPRPRKKPGACQMPKCRRLGNYMGGNDLDLRMCDKHAADDRVARYVKQRDGCCLRCGSVEYLQAAHVIRRGYYAVRWSVHPDPRDPSNNVITLCRSCHMWQTHHPLEGDDWFREYGIDYDNLRYMALHDPPMDPDDVLHWLSGETQ